MKQPSLFMGEKKKEACSKNKEGNKKVRLDWVNSPG